MFFKINNFKKAYINDINKELINCYRCIKINVKKVIEYLRHLANEYLTTEDKEEYYYDVRKRYNEIHLNGHEDYEKCADFIFLNKTCFNGLYALDEKDCLLMLSNSDPKNANKEDNFFDNLYKDFEIKRVYAKRIINCQASKRGNITEIVVMNYKRNT